MVCICFLHPPEPAFFEESVENSLLGDLANNPVERTQKSLSFAFARIFKISRFEKKASQTYYFFLKKKSSIPDELFHYVSMSLEKYEICAPDLKKCRSFMA